MMSEITPLERARRTRRSGAGYLDLVASDFRGAGLHLPEELYRRAWTRWRSAPSYVPDARGDAAARTSVAAFLTEDGLPTEADQVCLTAGSSISYSMIFRVLRERRTRQDRRDRQERTDRQDHRRRAADTVALPRPGYPLFEDLVRGAGLEPVTYDLPLHSGYSLDANAIRTVLLAARPLALVLISPNNPTGAIYDDSSIAELVRICGELEVPIISDEVFSAYRPADFRLPRPAAIADKSVYTELPRPAAIADKSVDSPPLVFSLNGLSKLCAAPEIKLGWIAVHGSSGEVVDTLEALEMEHDTYLTVSGYAEAACREFLAKTAADDRRVLAEGVRTRRKITVDALSRVESLSIVGEGLSIVGEGETRRGGVHLVIRFDAELCARSFGTVDDAVIAEVLVRTWGVYLHPGYLYGIDTRTTGTIDPFMVITCLNRPQTIVEGVDRLRHALRGSGVPGKG